MTASAQNDPPLLVIEPSAEKEPAAGKDASAEKQPPRPVTSLPLLFIKQITDEKAHRCKCPEVCEPNFDENRIAHIKSQIRDDQKLQIKDNEKLRIEAAYHKKHEQKMKDEVRIALNKEVIDRSKARAKRNELQQLEKQIREDITATATTQLEKDFEDRVSRGVQEKLDEVFSAIRLRPAASSPSPAT